MEITSIKLLEMSRKAHTLLMKELKQMHEHLVKAIDPLAPEKELEETISHNLSEQKDCKRVLEALNFEIGKK